MGDKTKKGPGSKPIKPTMRERNVFELRGGTGNMNPFRLMADMGFTSGPDGGPGGDKTSQTSVEEDIKVNIDEGKFGLPQNYGADQGEFGRVGNDWNKNRSKSNKGKLDDVKTAILQSNFVRKHRKLNMALTNTFYGTKYGKDSNRDSRYEFDTPWKRYRDAVKTYKRKEIYEKTDPFSKERRLAKQDLRGRFDSTGKRLSAKNIYQQKYLVGRRRGKDGNIVRAYHTPNIPEFKNRVSFAEWRQNKRNKKEIQANQASYAGYGVLKEQGYGGGGQGMCGKGGCLKP